MYGWHRIAHFFFFGLLCAAASLVWLPYRYALAGERSILPKDPSIPSLLGPIEDVQGKTNAMRTLLVIFPNFKAAHDYSAFLNSLKQAGYLFNFITYDMLATFTQSEPAESQFIGIIFFDYNLQKGVANTDLVGQFLEYVDKGGNLLIINDQNHVSSFIINMASSCGIKFLSNKEKLMDFTTQKNDVMVDIAPLPPISSVSGSMVYEGFVHTLDPTNKLTFSLLHPPLKSMLYSSGLNGNPLGCGAQSSLISVMQGRNGARVVFSGSPTIFSNAQFDINKPSGLWLKDVVNWNFKKRGLLAFSGLTHHKVGEATASNMYKMKDHLVFSIDLHELKDGYWVPYQSDDVQLELVMLNPYLRMFLDAPKNASSPTYSKTFQSPDHYGVFKFLIYYARFGYNVIEVESLAPLRNFKHNDYPRFIGVAYPYYASAFAGLIGVLFFAFYFIFGVDGNKVNEKIK